MCLSVFLSVIYHTKTGIFHIRTVHRDIIKVFYSPTNAQVTVFQQH